MRPLISLAAIVVSALPAFPALIATNEAVLCNSGSACQTLANQSTTLNYSNTVTNGANSISVTAFADENLSTGALKASDSYSEPSAESFYTQFNSSAQLSDTFTINAPGLMGTLGYLVIPFVLTGTTSANGQGAVAAVLSDPAGTTTQGCPVTSANCYVQGNATVVTLPMSFHYGTAFNLFWALAAITYAAAALTGSSDYSHTATIGFDIFNSQHQQIYDATVVASGGEQIPLLTPEPGSLVLVGICLALIAVTFRRRNRITGTRS